MARGGGERIRARVEVEEDMVEMGKVEVDNEVVSDFISGMAVWMRVKAERMAPSSWPGKKSYQGDCKKTRRLRFRRFRS